MKTREEIYKELFNDYKEAYIQGKIGYTNNIAYKAPEQIEALIDKANRRANIYAVQNTEWAYQNQSKD